MTKLINEFKEKRKNDDFVHIEEENVRMIIENLKNGKAVGFSGVSNEMLKHGNTKVINSTLTYLMEWMINTATIPKLFNISILKPLIKDHTKGSNQLSNLRPLSISDLYTHIFEKLILIEVRIDHCDHKKQFCFRGNASCSHATFILKEILNYNRSRNKTTYVIAIDASKAFDRVSRTKLWITMFQMGIRPVLILALKAYYTSFYIIVNNGRDYACPFLTTYGVKQGGCISPELYKLYSEIIAVLISALKLGAEYGNMKIDVLMYADDVIIIATCPKEAQLMLDEVSKVSTTHEIKFNPEKTNLMIFSPRKDDKDLILLLCGQPIGRSNAIKYLGTEITSNYNNMKHVETRKKKVAISINNLNTSGIMNSQMNIQTKLKLFKVYIKPLLTYGCEMLDLDANEMSELKKCEGNAIKQIVGIAKKCHTTPLYGAHDTTNEIHQTYSIE